MPNSSSGARPNGTGTRVRLLTEGALMIALNLVLSLIPVIRFPWGGGVTLLSMLPVCLFGIRHGVRRGLSVCAVSAVLHLGLGMLIDGLLAWGLTPLLLLGCAVLDYLLPFTLLGLAGAFRGRGKPGVYGGILLAVGLRLCCHVASGALIFASVGLIWDISVSDPWLYSLIYNAAYMVPEAILTCAGAGILMRFIKY